MGIGEIIQGGGLVISGAALVKLLDFALNVWSARHQKTQVEPTPLPVAMADKYVTCEQCALRHAEVEKRFQAGNTAFKELRKEITGMREDLHAGLGKITDRISPIAEACAANGAAIRILLNEEKR